MVPGAGIEPARYCYRKILSLVRLPISPPGQTGGGGTRSRTEVDGFAIHCIATLLFRHNHCAIAYHYYNTKNPDFDFGAFNTI